MRLSASGFRYCLATLPNEVSMHTRFIHRDLRGSTPVIIL